MMISFAQYDDMQSLLRCEPVIRAVNLFEFAPDLNYVELYGMNCVVKKRRGMIIVRGRIDDRRERWEGTAEAFRDLQLTNSA